MNVSNLERDNHTAVTQVAEQQSEIEHLKAELVESRSQYKECAQEVNVKFKYPHNQTQVSQYETVDLWS